MSVSPAVRLSALYFTYFAFVGAFSPYFALYLKEIGQSALQIAALLSLIQLMRVFAPYLWAGAADRSGERVHLLRLALGLAAASWCGLFFARDYWALFAVLALVGFFTSAAMPLAESLTFAHLRDDLGRYGLIRVWGSIGFIAAVLGLGTALDRLPIAALLPITLSTLILTCASSAMVRESTAEVRHGAHEPVWPFLAQRDAIALFGACFLMCVAHGPLYTFYSILLADQGYSKSVIGVLWCIGVIAEIGVFLVMPGLFRRWSARTVLAFSLGAAVVRFLMIGWGVESLALLVLAQLLHGASFGSYHAAALGLVSQRFREGHRSRGQALFTSLTYGAGGMVGGLASGLAWEPLGPAWTFTLASASAAAGLGIALSLKTDRPHSSSRPAS